MKYQYKKAPNPTEYSLFTGLLSENKDFSTADKDVPCQAACPVKTDVPAYINEIVKENYDKAYRINQEDNVFPGVLGRICARPCEESCRHNWTNTQGPVQICHLKRTSADNFKIPPKPLSPWFETSGKTVVIIGGGPAGLAAARELKRYGHEITIYEKENHLGGMLQDGIPKFRLPRNVINDEINLIIDSGIHVKLGQRMSGLDVFELKKKHDAILLATGTTIPKNLDLQGVHTNQVITGLNFMKEYNDDKINKLQGDIIIIGGGFTAVDCARACARAASKLVGSEDSVTIMYRRTGKQMAADPTEQDEINIENIKIHTLVNPIKIKEDALGKILSVIFQRNVIKPDNISGKPAIETVEDGEFEVPCSYLIVAIGQEQDWSILPDGVTNLENYKTTDEKIFLTGDLASGSLDVINAVAGGKTAADIIDQYLMKTQRRKKHISVELLENDGETGRFRDHDLQEPKKMPMLNLEKRIGDDPEVELGFLQNQHTPNATRCYLCNHKFEINNDKCIQCNWCIEVSPRECIFRISELFKDSNGIVTGFLEANKAEDTTYIHINSDNCIRCGKCLRVCPTEAITMRRTERRTCNI